MSKMKIRINHKEILQRARCPKTGENMFDAKMAYLLCDRTLSDGMSVLYTGSEKRDLARAIKEHSHNQRPSLTIIQAYSDSTSLNKDYIYQTNNKLKEDGLDFSIDLKSHIYMKRQFNENVFVLFSKTEKHTVAVLDEATPLFKVAVILPVLIPWAFTDKPITDREKEVIKDVALVPSEVNDCTYEKLKEANALDEITRQNFEKWYNGFKQNQISSLTNWIREHQLTLNRIMDQVRDTADLIEQKQNELAAVELGLSKNMATDLLEFVEANKSILAYRFEGALMYIDTLSTVEYYDKEFLKILIDSEDSYINIANSKEENEELRTIFKETFYNENYKLAISDSFICQVPLSIAIGGFNYSGGLDFGSNAIYNPHHYDFGCLGSYSEQITEAITNNNLITAIEICVAASKEINFRDSTVISKFAQKILESKKHSDFKPFIDKEGNRFSYSEVVERSKNNG